MTATRTLAFVMAVGLSGLTGCEEMPAPADTPVEDGGVPLMDAPELDMGFYCSDPVGYTTCSGGYGRTCCTGGIGRIFNDGPCAMSGSDAGAGDAGVACANPNDPGCPCATEGAMQCPTGNWRVTCIDGEWTRETGYMCCS